MNTQPNSSVVLLGATVLFGLAIAGPIGDARQREHVDDGAAGYVDMLAGSQALRAAIGDRARIGYASDGSVDIRVGGAAQGRYYLSQFALAPVLLDLESAPTLRHELVLLSFEDPEAVAPFLQEHGLRDVVVLNANVVLARKRGR